MCYGHTGIREDSKDPLRNAGYVGCQLQHAHVSTNIGKNIDV